MWKRRQSCCTSGLLISKDSLSETMETHGTTVPLETRAEFFINSEIMYNIHIGHDVVCELEHHYLLCSGVPSILFWSCWVRSNSFCSAHKSTLVILWYCLG